MKSKLSIISLLLLFVCSADMRAEVLTLDSCLERAKQHNCTIQSAKLDVAVSQEVKKQVLWKYFPLVSINGFGYGSIKPLINIDVVSMAGGDTGDLLKGLFDMLAEVSGKEYSSEINWLRWGASAQAQLIQPIYWGGQIVNGNKLAKLGIDASKLKAEVSERDVLQEVTEHYWLVSGLLDKRATVEKAIALIDSIDNVAQVAFNHGLVTKNDILQVQLKRNEIESKRLQLENGIQLASRMLCHLVNIEYTPDLELERLADNDAIDVLVAVPESFNIDNRPETKLLDLQVKYEKMMRKMSLGEALPHFFLGLQGGYSNFFEKNNFNGLAFASLTIPLTQWGETSHKLKQHDIRIRQAEMQRDDLQGKLRLQNEQVYDQLTESVKLLEQHRAAKELAEDNYNLALMNYKAGISTMTDLLQAETLLLQAENNYTDANITFLTAQRKFNDFNN